MAGRVSVDALHIRNQKIKEDLRNFENEIRLKSDTLVKNPALLRQYIDRLRGLSQQSAEEQAAVHASTLAAEALALLASCGEGQAKSLAGRGALPSPDELFSRLVAVFPSGDGRAGRMDFRLCGCVFSAFSFDAPVFVPMLGPLAVQPKVKAALAKKAQNAPVERDMHVLEKFGGPGGQHAEGGEGGGGGAADNDALAEAENSRRAFDIYDRLQALLDAGGRHVRTKVVLEGDGKPCMRPLIQMIPVLFDGWSYTQTIENVFYFSFLVQRGIAGVVMGQRGADDSPGDPYIALFGADAANLDAAAALREGDDDEDGGADAAAGGGKAAKRAGAVHKSAGAAQRKAASDVAVQSCQTILHIDPESWKLICEHFGMSRGAGVAYEPVLPHYHSQDSLAPVRYKYASSAAALANAARQRAATASASAAAAAPRVGSKRKAPPATASAAAAVGGDSSDESDSASAARHAKPAPRRPPPAPSAASNAAAAATAAAAAAASQSKRARVDEYDEDAIDD